MDDCGAVLHNIETKWLYDFLTLEKCRNFSQAAVSRNVSQPAFSRRIRALEQAIGVELFNRQVTPLQLSEQGKIFHSQIRHLLQQLESNLAELRGGSDYAQRKIKIAAAHSLSLGLLPSIISQMPPLFTWAMPSKMVFNPSFMSVRFKNRQWTFFIQLLSSGHFSISFFATNPISVGTVT